AAPASRLSCMIVPGLIVEVSSSSPNMVLVFFLNCGTKASGASIAQKSGRCSRISLGSLRRMSATFSNAFAPSKRRAPHTIAEGGRSVSYTAQPQLVATSKARMIMPPPPSSEQGELRRRSLGRQGELQECGTHTLLEAGQLRCRACEVGPREQRPAGRPAHQPLYEKRVQAPALFRGYPAMRLAGLVLVERDRLAGERLSARSECL